MNGKRGNDGRSPKASPAGSNLSGFGCRYGLKKDFCNTAAPFFPVLFHSTASRRRRRRKPRQPPPWSRPPRAASPAPKRPFPPAAATRRKRRRASWTRSWNSSRARLWICSIKSNSVLGEIWLLTSYSIYLTKTNTIHSAPPQPAVTPLSPPKTDFWASWNWAACHDFVLDVKISDLCRRYILFQFGRSIFFDITANMTLFYKIM